MTGIYHFAENPFDSRLITDDRLATFGADCAEKLRSTHPDHSAAVTAATAALSGLQGKVSVEDAQKQGGTDGVDVFLEELAQYMSDAEAQVIVSFKKGSVAYNAIYPNKRQTYTRLNKTEAPAVLEALKKVMDEQGAALPAEMRTRMTGFRAAWDDARAAQNVSEGQLSGSRSARDAVRAELEDALFDALLDLSRQYRKTPQTLKNYFDHTLLKAHRHSSLEHAQTAPAS